MLLGSQKLTAPTQLHTNTASYQVCQTSESPLVALCTALGSQSWSHGMAKLPVDPLQGALGLLNEKSSF